MIQISASLMELRFFYGLQVHVPFHSRFENLCDAKQAINNNIPYFYLKTCFNILLYFTSHTLLMFNASVILHKMIYSIQYNYTIVLVLKVVFCELIVRDTSPQCVYNMYDLFGNPLLIWNRIE